MPRGNFLVSEHFHYVREGGTQPKKPFRHIHMFVKNNQRMTSWDFSQTSKAIHDYMGDLGVNFGMLMTADGTYVFTEKRIKLNDLVVKLATGINYNGLVENASGDLKRLNDYLGRSKA
jgi:hypothetical protein